MRLLNIRKNREFVKDMLAAKNGFVARESAFRLYNGLGASLAADSPLLVLNAGFSPSAAKKAMRIRKRLEPKQLFTFTDERDFYAKKERCNKSSIRPAVLSYIGGEVHSYCHDGYKYSAYSFDGFNLVFRQKNNGRELTMLDGRFCVIEVNVDCASMQQSIELKPNGKINCPSAATLSYGTAVDVEAEQKAIKFMRNVLFSAGLAMLQFPLFAVPCFFLGWRLRKFSNAFSDALGEWAKLNADGA